MVYHNIIIYVLCFVSFFQLIQSVRPVKQIDLYPNTQDSPSLYLISFVVENQLTTGSYIIFNFGNLADPVDPYHCLLVNTSISIRCTNFDNPEFEISFDKSQMKSHNPILESSFYKCVILELLDPIYPETEYFLQIALLNKVQNIQRFSQSCEIYCVSSKGLIYEQNLNFDSILYQPPVLPLLNASILNNLNQNKPGVLSTLKVQIKITLPISTSYSTLFFVLQDPFKFSNSSYLRIDESEDYATNPIPLNSAPTVAFFQVRTPSIFYVAFAQKFVSGRKFIIQITEIQNPFFISESNISIYSSDFNSLTPLQQFQSRYPLITVSQPLNLILGLPYDMQLAGPCTFYRSTTQFFKISFSMPMSVPQGYSIKLYFDKGSISYGSAFVNFQSLAYTTIYKYTSSSITMSGMGPILQGSSIYITFKAFKDSNTNFFVSVTIDTDSVIQQSTALSYMFYGRVDGIAQDSDSILSEFQDTKIYEHLRVTSYDPNPSDPTYYDNYKLRVSVINSGQPTSAGSYFQMYLSPLVQFNPSYNKDTDCYFQQSGFTWGSCISTVNKTSQFVHIKVVGSSSFLSSFPNPFDGTRIFYIRNIRFPVISTNKNIYQSYFRLFKSSGVNPDTYIQLKTITVQSPPFNSVNMTLKQYSNTYNLDVRYPGLVRLQCKDSNIMNYKVEQNQARVITFISLTGFRGMGQIENQGKYPCTSNINVECYYYVGITGNYETRAEWDRINIFFPDFEENTTNFHVIVPSSNLENGDHIYEYHAGVYNYLTKDFKYYFRSSEYVRPWYNGWYNSPQTIKTSMQIDFQGKAGSYRDNVSITVATNSISNGLNFLIITSQWSLFQNDKTVYGTTTYAPASMGDIERSPLSVLMDDGMYITFIPFQCSGCASSFTFTMNQFHMPYHYDLPNYYIYTFNPSGNMASYNVFEMTNGGIFYEAYLKSLTLSCLDNYLGVKNTQCQIRFQTNSPFKADSNLTIVFSGMNIATDICEVFLPTGALLETVCSSTQDNKNISISLVDKDNVYQYPSNNFTIKIRGVSIEADKISQSMTLYLHDKTGKYVIEKGTRIFTTTVARPDNIEVSEIVYSYASPLSANKLSLTFTIPRGLYEDERFGFIMGQDLSDINLQIKRLKIVLTRLSDGLVIKNTNQLITTQYKILFNFEDESLLVAGSYSLEIFGIMTPSSHQNGAFSIIYQRNFDKAFTLTNNIETVFPEFQDRIISNISLDSFYNTEGFEQKLVFTIVNREKAVDDSMLWIINFPSYYSSTLFNFQPYCMIDNAPIQCYPDPTTPYQMIVKNSPKSIDAESIYTLSIYRLASPSYRYTHDIFKSRYIFIGVLQNENSEIYIETSLLYPYQLIEQSIFYVLVIEDISVTTITNPTFSSVYMIMNFECMTDIIAGSYIFVIFPKEFDNFNNVALSVIMKKISPLTIIPTGTTTVTDRTLSFQVNSLIPANTKFAIEFPSLPTPRVECSVQMSQTIAFITTSDMKIVTAKTSITSNSAPIIQFTKDPLYISFNQDNTVVITAGTYSNMIDITSSDSQEFISNVNVQLSSSGFIFEPSKVFLRIGDTKAQFRIGADAGLLPISYFYETTKTQQFHTHYTITKNNNIKVTNTPVNIVLPTQIFIPIGGCSKPFQIDIVNAPVNDLLITQNYNNSVYDQTIFWPNEHVMKSQLQFLPNVTKKIASFCISSQAASKISSGVISSSFLLKFVLAGTNYASYRFSPSAELTVNIQAATPIASPTLSIETINQQKNFLSFNLTTNIYSILYYHFKIGTSQSPLSSNEIKIKAKNNLYALESMDDYLSRMYTYERDERIGVISKQSGESTITFNNLLPQRYYTLCLYMETQYNQINSPKCVTSNTQQWGTIMKASVTFSTQLSAENLNKILCFFTQQIDTEVYFVIDLNGNSCGDSKVQNLYYKYPGQTFTFQNTQSHIYVLPNPALPSDPSIIAFQNLYNSSKVLTPTALAEAVADFAINYLQSTLIATFDAITMTDNTNADSIVLSFDKPVYDSAAKIIKISNIQLTDQGTVYFMLLLYKQIILDGNNSYVNIRLTTQPSKQQLLNCENWQGLAADGCARAVYSKTSLEVVFDNIRSNCMYLLYYVVANQYPIRPILASEMRNDTVVTLVSWERSFGVSLGVVTILIILGLLI